MKKTMFVTAMLITVMVTMLATNFAFAAASDPVPPDDLVYDRGTVSTYYAPQFMIATTHRGNYALSLSDDRSPATFNAPLSMIATTHRGNYALSLSDDRSPASIYAPLFMVATTHRGNYARFLSGVREPR